MDFLELEGKAQLERFGIPINESFLLKGDEIPENLPMPCVLKGQILSGKRGKAGAVKVVKTIEEFKKVKSDIEKITINDLPMEGVIACGLLDIKAEYYLGMTLDTTNRKMLLLFTPYGGMDVEELVEKTPEKLLKFDVTNGFCSEKFVDACKMFDLEEKYLNQVIDISKNLVKAGFELDATTIEINPLALLSDDTLLAIDAKLTIDDNAMYRQGDYELIERKACEHSSQELEAMKYDLTYIELDPQGDIGTMAGGAGIGMATMDTITHYGGKTNNFLDLGGGVTAEKTYHAMKILLENKSTNYIFVNIFGGINNCADMAEGIKKAYLELGIKKPVMVKSRGFNQEHGWKIYEELGFSQTKFGTTDEAVIELLKIKERG